MKRKHISVGFTLIELMIVIAILGVLIAVGLTNFKSVQIKSRDARRKNNLRQIATALEYYYNDYGTYPPHDSSSHQIKGCGTDGATACAWESPFQTVKADGVTPKTIYMPKLPGDPSTGRTYYYVRSGTSPPSYKLYALLENSQDSEMSSDIIAEGLSCVTVGAGTCNYGIASTNTKP